MRLGPITPRTAVAAPVVIGAGLAAAVSPAAGPAATAHPRAVHYVNDDSNTLNVLH
jgi:hypothetical protein